MLEFSPTALVFNKLSLFFTIFRVIYILIQGEHKVFPWLKTFITRKLRGIKTYIFLLLFKLVSKVLCHVLIVTFGFWMQHFQIGGLGEMVRHPGHHDRRISPPSLLFMGVCYGQSVFDTSFRYYKFEGKNNRRFCYNNSRHVGEHVERNWFSIRRSPCNKRSTCWSVLMCCKKLIDLRFKNLYSTYSSFLVINVCNQGKILCSPCVFFPRPDQKNINYPNLMRPGRAADLSPPFTAAVMEE